MMTGSDTQVAAGVDVGSASGQMSVEVWQEFLDVVGAADDAQTGDKLQTTSHVQLLSSSHVRSSLTHLSNACQLCINLSSITLHLRILVTIG